MATYSIRLPEHLVRQLDDLSSTSGTTRSELMREAVAEYCARARSSRKLEPVELLDRLVKYPGSGIGDLAKRDEHYLRKLFAKHRRRRSR